MKAKGMAAFTMRQMNSGMQKNYCTLRNVARIL